MELNNLKQSAAFKRAILISGAVLVVFFLAVYFRFGQGEPTYDPSWHYMTIQKDEHVVVMPFPASDDCRRFAEAAKGKCFTGVEMAAGAVQNKSR